MTTGTTRSTPMTSPGRRKSSRSPTRDTGRYHSEYRIVTPEGETRNVRAIGTVYKDPGTSRQDRRGQLGRLRPTWHSTKT